MSVLGEKGAQDRLPALATIASREGLPALSKKLVEKIEVWEFVDFAEMPPTKEKSKVHPAHWKAGFGHTGCLSPGVLKVHPGPGHVGSML